jgi:Coenzyme PQQ synthesis protein D (PqqD)
MISNTEHIVIPAGIREISSEDGAVLLDIEQGICFSLNPVGMRIWELLKQHCSLKQIVDNLEESFRVPGPQLMSDIADFIAALEANGLIRRANVSEVRGSSFRKWLALRWTNRNR